jgi:signal transduction histidine kinase/ActR/RegA family two-component response regulator
MNHSTTYRTTWLVWLLAGIGLSAGAVTLVIVGAALWNVMAAKERQDVLHRQVSQIFDQARKNKRQCDAELRWLLSERPQAGLPPTCKALVLDAATVTALRAADDRIGLALGHVQETAAQVPALHAACRTWARDNTSAHRELLAARQRAETTLFQLRDQRANQPSPSRTAQHQLAGAIELQLAYERLLRAESTAELASVRDDQFVPLARRLTAELAAGATGDSTETRDAANLARAISALADCSSSATDKPGLLSCGSDDLIDKLERCHELRAQHEQLEKRTELLMAAYHAATDVLREAELHFTRRAAAETGHVLHRAWRAILLTAALALGFFLGIAWMLPRAVTAQLEAVNDAAREIELARRKLKAQNIALDQAHKRAEVASQGKSEFLAMVSHEFRTPLTSVLGYCDILLTRPLPGDAQESVLTIQRNGQHLLSVVSDIMDLSKIEAGRLDVQTGPCSLLDLARESADLLAPRCRAKRLELVLHAVGRFPAVVQADATRLRQILINVLATAVELAESGAISLTAQCHPSHSSWTISVAVPEVALTTEQIERLFEPFVNSAAVSARGRGDMGLGLSISRRLATLLGGEIRVTSDAQRGTTFELTTPIGILRDTPLVEALNFSSGASTPPSDGPLAATLATPAPSVLPGRKPAAAESTRLDSAVRILVAEDGPDNQRLIATVLKRLGAEIEIVSNGSQAVELALNAWRTGCPYAVILMDMQMPVLDGYAATRRLRDEGYDGPIIALTAHAMAHDRQKCLDAGCTDYSTKPLQIPMLQNMVRHYATVSRATA